MDDAIAVLLLPDRLEGFTLEAHARELLSIPRVVALEPSRVRTPRFLREAAAARQAARLRFPGQVRLLVLYHPAQYPLARALSGRHPDAELWYLAADAAGLPGSDADRDELLAFDELARQRAAQTLAVSDHGVDEEPLRQRLRELEVISPRAFVPGARFRGR